MSNKWIPHLASARFRMLLYRSHLLHNVNELFQPKLLFRPAVVPGCIIKDAPISAVYGGLTYRAFPVMMLGSGPVIELFKLKIDAYVASLSFRYLVVVEELLIMLLMVTITLFVRHLRLIIWSCLDR